MGWDATPSLPLLGDFEIGQVDQHKVDETLVALLAEPADEALSNPREQGPGHARATLGVMRRTSRSARAPPTPPTAHLRRPQLALLVRRQAVLGKRIVEELQHCGHGARGAAAGRWEGVLLAHCRACALSLSHTHTLPVAVQ